MRTLIAEPPAPAPMTTLHPLPAPFARWIMALVLACWALALAPHAAARVAPGSAHLAQTAAPAPRSKPTLEAVLQQRAAEDKATARERTVLQVVLALMLLTALVLLVLPLRLISQGEPPPPGSGLLKSLLLPRSLTRISVYKKEYDVTSETGIVYEKEIWTETHFTTIPADSSSQLPSTYGSSTVFYRLWLRDLDGREYWRKFAEDQFPTSKGQIVTSIHCGPAILVLYNHQTGQIVTTGYDAQHNWAGKGLGRRNLCALALGCLVIAVPIFIGHEFPDSLGIWLIFLIGMLTAGVLLSALYIGILELLLRQRRNQEFNQRYLPQLRRFLSESTPQLVKHFADQPARP